MLSSAKEFSNYLSEKCYYGDLVICILIGSWLLIVVQQ